ncbi:MAG: DUF3160 domain-containing protein [Paludibacter sp.]|nr:DUF3160 domain-containing protein [Paludibacter sp.]
MKTKIFLFIFTVSVFVSCVSKKANEQFTENLSINLSGVNFNLDSIDLNANIDSLSLQDLRLLRNAVYAKYGYLFMEADVRSFFSANMKTYDSLMYARWEYESYSEYESNIPKVEPLKLTSEETDFVKRIDERIALLKQNNFVQNGDYRLANVKNIVNLFQFKDISSEFLQKLSENNMVITQSANIQLFNIYEENDYRQVPNFVTTDLMLQAFHMYFSYTLKYLETKKLINIVENLCYSIYSNSMTYAKNSTDADLRQTAEYNAVFYAIPYSILSGKTPEIPEKYKIMFNTELKNIEKQEDNPSEFLDFLDAKFPYSQFKPRGHYTRTEKLKHYFSAMQWLQLAVYCREKSEQLKNAVFVAALLNEKNQMKSYNAVYEPIEFLIGESDNLSVMDIANFLKNNKIENPAAALQTENIAKVNEMLIEVAKNRNAISPIIEISCHDKINFMPARYLVDNEIISKLVDVNANAKRAYPKGLDIFAAFGSKPAMDILVNTYKEPNNWADFLPNMNKLQQKFKNYDKWNVSVYNKWIESLLAMQKTDKSYPDFMKLPSWDKKNLNTSLASWAELKHDAILYSEQPMTAECGGFDPPDPICVGYVEPNINFWNKFKELISLTDKMLRKNNLMTEDLENRTNQLKEYADFLLNTSKKELNKQKLTDSEYNTIEKMGASIDYFTLSVIDPDAEYTGYWDNVQGADKSIAVVADIYTRNILGCNKSGILHEATGKANNIYVVVEIEGSLYLTKGATFSYYEFVQPLNTRLTDEEWQQKLESKDGIPPFPVWMNDMILKTKDDPKVDERVFYSSGC